MNLQDATLKQFQEVFNGPTLKEISTLTGIQMTRIFRLMNGYEMKLSEWESMNCAIHTKVNQDKQSIINKFMWLLKNAAPLSLEALLEDINTQFELHQRHKDTTICFASSAI